jgi:hypothetical protein
MAADDSNNEAVPAQQHTKQVMGRPLPLDQVPSR